MSSGHYNITYEDSDEAFNYIDNSDFSVFDWQGYDGTNGKFHNSDTVGAQFTFSSPVAGIALYYYGLLRSDGALYRACVDCDPVQPAWTIINAVNLTDDGNNPPVVLYSHTFNTPGFHSLIVENLKDPILNGTHLTVDRVVVTVQDGNSSSTPAPNNSNKLSDSPKKPTGSIVGGLVGGVAGILLLVALFVWLRRRRKLRMFPLEPNDKLPAHSFAIPLQPPNATFPVMQHIVPPAQAVPSGSGLVNQDTPPTYDQIFRSRPRKGA